MRIEPYLKPDWVMVLSDVSSRDDLFARLAEIAAARLDGVNAAELVQQLEKREEQGSTSTIEGVAFPHAMTPSIPETCVMVALVPKGIDFGVPSHPKSDLILCMLGSTQKPWEHLRLLARLSRLVFSEQARSRLRAAESSESLLDRLTEEDRSHG